MAFEQELTITMSDCCDTIDLCDATCEPNPCNTTPCLDGYGVDGNINKWDVASTAFNITFPDGNLIPALDIGYVPNNRAYGWVEITGGTTGTFSVSVATPGTLATVPFNTSIATTLNDLILAINANSGTTGFRSYADSITPTKIWIYAIAGGIVYNTDVITIGVTGDMAGTSSGTVDGGTADAECKSLTLTELWALNAGTVYNNNSGPSYADGVYVFEMISYDNTAPDPLEIGRQSETVLFDCNAVNCLKESLIVGEGCGCDDKYDERILKTRLKIEQARHQFNECLFDCAQESILSAGEMCNDVCIDC
jgi:hypothetical protein